MTEAEIEASAKAAPDCQPTDDDFWVKMGQLRTIARSEALRGLLKAGATRTASLAHSRSHLE